MRGIGAKPHWKLVFISSVAFGIALATTLVLLHNSSQTEKASAQLFWNGYAKLYYELTGSWDGLEERLYADRYMSAEDKSLWIKVYNSEGSVKVAELASGNSSTRQERKMAVLSNGNIVGYTETAISSQSLLSFIGIPLMIAIFIYAAGLWHLSRTLRVKKQTEQLAAAAIWKRAAARGTEAAASDSVSGSFSAALKAVDDLALKVERLETVRRTMVADIAHELRTPIAIMRTQLDNAIQDGLPLPLAKTVSLHDETLRLTKLVRDLQELSLAESNHLALEKTWFSLTEMVAAIAETLVVSTEDHLINTKLDLDRDVRIYADETRIRQIIINLIGNAIGHTRNELCIAVCLANGQAEVTIIDDGWGIEEEELDFVFDRFYRGKTYSQAGKRAAGLGLGLAIAKQFAIAHGGALTVSSKFGEGAAFTLSLPIITE
ncbi:signal transduction histidine kinase [Paenibacillus castaneae]|uniref:sensor histidine kinase n=1 Tax=Paenibacillus castaneae TaxID=474957 RepID=UPI000C9B56DF|nr:HAMP domain-containing sensor histidine kinase [Paenibacillus castaneae]NIK77887.1 signal transduction histidine kinase [Paenibacillus castaneae]